MLQRFILVALVLLGVSATSFAQTNTKGVEFNTQSSNPCGVSMSCMYTTSTGVKTLSTAGDGATAIAYQVNTSTAWSNAAAKLLSLATNSVEKFYVAASTGDVVLTSSAKITGTDFSFSVGDATHRASAINFRHLVSGQSAAPQCTPGAGLGAGGTCSCTGSDTAMECTFTTGSGTASGTMGTVTFNTAFGSNPYCVSVSSSQANAGTIGWSSAIDRSAGSTTTFVMKNATAGAAGTPYPFQIHCIDAT